MLYYPYKVKGAISSCQVKHLSHVFRPPARHIFKNKFLPNLDKVRNHHSKLF